MASRRSVNVALAMVATASSATALLDRLGRIASPHERRVTGHQHGGHRQRIQAGESLDDHAPRVGLVRLCHFLGRQRARDGNRSEEVIGMGRPQTRDLQARLGECRGLRAVRVRDPADALKMLVQPQCVGVSDDGRRSPSTTFPSRSTTTICSGRIDA